MNRKPVFDVIRRLLGGKLDQRQVDQIDLAITKGLVPPEMSTAGPAAATHSPRRLGSLSERYECGERGPGAVSSGRHDPGGVSYGLFQLSSRTGTAAPGSPRFSEVWQAIAAREPEAFAQAQRTFIARTHYQPVIRAVLDKTGLDLDRLHHAVRDAVWSTAVQHGGATRIVTAAIAKADAQWDRASANYEPALVSAIYDERSAYVLRVAERPGLSPRERGLLSSIVANRFVSEKSDALAMFDRR